ncbi:isoleucine--tRNA ligase [Mariniblastus sp.]|nr:isoleucine--tRNA ligase [Mariniblastus sp.]
MPDPASKRFQPVENNVSLPNLEESILEFWREKKIYDRSLEQRTGQQKYVFFEGPPTANGKPHPGHCLTRAIKDLFPRYKTMQGFFCRRKAGWDTHGLPVEVEVCKELGIHSKEDIEDYGVEPFIHKCQQSVFTYMKNWEQLTERLGFWVKLDDAYVTYHQSYVESVWWSLKTLFDNDLLYQGHKIIWWWAQGGTALSSGEVGEGYKTVMDPSIYVLFPLVDRPDTSLLVWTTTPWTMPSNQFAAVNKKIEYATVYDPELDQNIVLAADLVEKISEKVKRELEVKSTEKGLSLVGERYVPPFDYFYKDQADETGTLKDGGSQHLSWRVTEASFVTTDSGSGAVHEAPPFGEVDYELLVAEQLRFVPGEGPQMFCPVAPNGKFTSEVPDFEGQWVKDADKPITRMLKDRGKLYHQEQYQHEYPFCWRADQDPLIQYPRESWFVRTKKSKDQMIANNQQINWLPGHIKDGRFGNFLESNVDWALSRERYWGTPLPIWVCDKTGKSEAVGKYDELMGKPGVTGMEVWDKAKAADPNLTEDLKIHKPYIDHIVYDSPFEAGGRMTRVPEVIDCWYDSGAMPFAQWGYPHQGNDEFKEQFPADFISEAIDQTRGWFYSQLAISTLLFGKEGVAEQNFDFPHPFKNCIVLGLMLSEWWKGQGDAAGMYLTPAEANAADEKTEHHVGKMSKSKRNYREPQGIFDKYGADALRWYFFANQPPWTSIRYSERQIKESMPEFLLRLWNVYSFFVLYANIDDFSPAVKDGDNFNPENLASGQGYRPVAERGELDRWVISELNRTVDAVVTSMDAYDNYGACTQLTAFVENLSNWFVRRSRDRFWAKDKTAPEKLDAYWTLFECLTTTSKLIAPFVPFMSETLWQNLTAAAGGGRESVHLCDYPTADSTVIDDDLSRRMSVLREVASLGLSARMAEKLKVRQPLSGVTVVLNDGQDQAWLEQHDELLKTELNVQSVTYTTDAGEFVTYVTVPNFKRLGPRVGKLMPKLKKAFADADGAAMLADLTANGKTSLIVESETIELDSEDIEVRLKANEGWAAAQGSQAVVVLSTELTPELIRSGYAREINRYIQDRRKELDLERTDRIDVWINTDFDELKQAIEENLDYLKGETLATSITLSACKELGVEPCEVQVGEHDVKIWIRVAK